MDPDANLKETLELAGRLVDDPETGIDATRLAELVLSLNDWISRGGYPPRQWRRKPWTSTS
jgi:hypothetical protein